MKKILSVITLASALFLTACDGEKPVYNFSDLQSETVASFVEQGAKEGFNAEESRIIFRMYIRYIGNTYESEIEENTKKGGKDVDIIIKHTQGKTLSEMKKLAAKEIQEYEEMLNNEAESK